MHELDNNAVRDAMRRMILAAVLCLPAVGASAVGFTLSTPDFRNGSTIPMVHVFNQGGCTGGNQSPALSWSGEPAGTQSFAVTIFDPDAPTGSGWWHWTVFNIPASVHSLPENAGAPESTQLPAGAIQGRNDYGFSAYGGPCPPAGRPHRYIVTVYAIKVPKLPLDAQSSGAMVGFMVHSNSLAAASTMGRYGRPR
jgi:Raf kinase inhibitor-like YbhB/YbcL family protein